MRRDAWAIPRAYMSIHTQFENIGDALITRQLIRLLARTASVAVDTSRCPEHFRRELGLADLSGVEEVNSARKLLWRLVRNRLRGRKTYYFLSPGGYHGEMSRSQARRYSTKTALFRLLSWCGVRICHVGVSYDRIGPRHHRQLARRSRLLFRHLVRDGMSQEFLERSGIRCHGRVPDLAFGARAECRVIADRPRNDVIAFTFRVDQAPDQAERLTRFVHDVTRALPSGWKVVVTAQVTRDISFNQRIASQLAAEGRDVTFVRCDHSFEACKETYGKTAYVVSNRLHALLGGALCGALPIPVVELPHNAKVSGWAKDSGIIADVIDPADPGAPAIVAQRIASGSAACLEMDAFSKELEESVDRVLYA